MFLIEDEVFIDGVKTLIKISVPYL